VKQGDRLGPLLFALKLQGHLERVAAAHPSAQIAAYFEGVNDLGPASSAVQAFDELAAEVRTLGLTPVPAKSAVHSPHPNIAAAAAAELGVRHAQHGLVVAGTPIGHWPVYT
jgi:hypothetical protein